MWYNRSPIFKVCAPRRYLGVCVGSVLVLLGVACTKKEAAVSPDQIRKARIDALTPNAVQTALAEKIRQMSAYIAIAEDSLEKLRKDGFYPGAKEEKTIEPRVLQAIRPILQGTTALMGAVDKQKGTVKILVDGTGKSPNGQNTGSKGTGHIYIGFADSNTANRHVFTAPAQQGGTKIIFKGTGRARIAPVFLYAMDVYVNDDRVPENLVGHVTDFQSYLTVVFQSFVRLKEVADGERRLDP